MLFQRKKLMCATKSNLQLCMRHSVAAMFAIVARDVAQTLRGPYLSLRAGHYLTPGGRHKNVLLVFVFSRRGRLDIARDLARPMLQRLCAGTFGAAELRALRGVAQALRGPCAGLARLMVMVNRVARHCARCAEKFRGRIVFYTIQY